MNDETPYDNPTEDIIKKINTIVDRTGESPETVTKILKASYKYYIEDIWNIMPILPD